jgi:hypothetical protein
LRALFLAFLVAASSALAAEPDSLRVAPDLHTPASQGGLRYFSGDHVLRDGATGSGQGYLTVSLALGTMQWMPPPTRFDAFLRGAGAATSLGMFLGAIGTTMGWFDEDTSWAITGAMAAAGAIYAGTRYQKSPTLEFKWGDDSVIPGYAPPVSR